MNVATEETIATEDSIATDTIVADPDPEWYVAPIPYDSVMARHKAPRRAAAANCPIDSGLTYDVRRERRPYLRFYLRVRRYNPYYHMDD